jgi:hypothetical protein
MLILVSGWRFRFLDGTSFVDPGSAEPPEPPLDPPLTTSGDLLVNQDWIPHARPHVLCANFEFCFEVLPCMSLCVQLFLTCLL